LQNAGHPDTQNSDTTSFPSAEWINDRKTEPAPKKLQSGSLTAIPGRMRRDWVRDDNISCWRGSEKFLLFVRLVLKCTAEIGGTGRGALWYDRAACVPLSGRVD
jgi:hypothetical protein